VKILSLYHCYDELTISSFIAPASEGAVFQTCVSLKTLTFETFDLYFIIVQVIAFLCRVTFVSYGFKMF